RCSLRLRGGAFGSMIRLGRKPAHCRSLPVDAAAKIGSARSLFLTALLTGLRDSVVLTSSDTLKPLLAVLLPFRRGDGVTFDREAQTGTHILPPKLVERRDVGSVSRVLLVENVGEGGVTVSKVLSDQIEIVNVHVDEGPHRRPEPEQGLLKPVVK